jgi:hypothetical protein
MVTIGQTRRLGRRVATMDGTRTRGSIHRWHGRAVMILLLVLTKTGGLQVEVDLLVFLLLLHLELLIHLIEFFEGDATRATSCTSRAA